MTETSSKLVIKGIPFEATADDVLKYFKIDASELTLPTWNSGRCKGVAFLELANVADVARIRNMDSAIFKAGENERKISIADFEERPPNQKKRKNKNRRRKNNNDDNVEEAKESTTKPVYEESAESVREVYVSNVSFKAEEADFHEHFKSCGEIESVTIPKLYASGRPKGFAFVRFKTKEGKSKALELNETTFKERTIGVRANKGRAQPQKQRERPARKTGLSEKPKNCTTIYVGNLPWSTDEAALEKLFEKCGKIESARIVRQSWTKKSRGFGYVEFADTASVDKAVKLSLTVEERELRLDFAEQLTQ